MCSLSGSYSLWKGRVNKIKLSFITSLLIVFTITGCSLIGQEYRYTSEEFIMNTFIKVQVYADSESKAKEAANKALQEFRRLELLSNRYAIRGTVEYDKSELIKINSAAGKTPVQVSKDIFEMLSLSKKYNNMLEGAFDITIGPIIDLWGFSQDSKTIPHENDLIRKLNLVDTGKMILDEKNRSVYLTEENMSLDLGGIAKGYATEKAAHTLREAGVKKAIINAGGNIYVIGEKAKGVPWKIGIEDPRDSQKLIAILSLKDQVAVTSGDYQRFFEVDGTRYHHILDPKTGKPARELISVTVVAENSAIADILSTSFFILGKEKSMAYLEKHPNIKAVFVTSDKRICYSPGMEKIIEFEKNGGYSFDQGG
jgi:thiamine biosynthesis lipoprotein